MKSFIKIPLIIILPALMLLTSACSVNRSNVEDAKNLAYHLQAFSNDSTQARYLIKAMERSAETFKSQEAPEKTLTMFEEVFKTLPKGAIPLEQITGQALVKSYILEAYSDSAKSAGLEKRAIQFLEALREEYNANPTGKKTASSLLNKYIESLKQPASAGPS